MEIKNLKKVSKRILKAIKNKEKIIVFSDSDLDGVVSAIIMEETISRLNGNIVKIYFPNREKEGYGISKKALLNLKKYTPCLLIATDLGVGNIEEVKIAKKLGFEIIIIDHHEVLKRVPTPAIVVDPKQKGDDYPFKQFAACGLVFLLSKEILREKMDYSLENNFLEITAMATIADMMVIKEDNKKIVEKGLSSIKNTSRPGLKVLFDIENSKSTNLNQKISRINALLNIRDTKKGFPVSYKILVSSSKKEALKLSKDLIKKNIKKKEKIKKIIEEIENKIKKKKEPIIFEGKSSWESMLLGTAGGVLSQKYKKPIFLYKKNQNIIMGSIRSSSKFNVVEAMKKCPELLITYGGHPQAAGFRLKEKNLNKFKKHLIDYFNNNFKLQNLK